MIAHTAKLIELEPLSGLFDARSPANVVPFGVWRYLQNAEMKEPRKLRRSQGWEKLLTRVGYNNQDLHDQLTGFTAGSIRQPITMLYQAVSTAGFSKLIAATSKRIFVLNNSTGNWRVISDQLANGVGSMCSDHGWVAAQEGNTVVFINGFDQPVYHVLDQPPDSLTSQSVSTIPDLVALKISRPKAIASFKGIIVMGNIVDTGERIAHRLIWSDVGRPLSWMPKAGESAASFQDLGYGEDIINMMPLADSLLVYTASGIWEGVIGGADTPLIFRKRYTAIHGSRCLAYHRTLVTTGAEHYYLGRDGVYRYNFYTDHPIREEWIHLASSEIFKDIDEDNCSAHVGGYNANEKSIYFSWARHGEPCAGKTMVLNTEYSGDYILDHGFSAFVNYNPDSVKTLREWVIENCICTQAAMNEAGLGFIKEGQFCDTPAVEECTPVQYLYTHIKRTVDDIMVEDWEQVVAHPDSLCAKLGDVTLNELCSGELTEDECNAEQIFVSASTQDFGLKQMGNVYSRERIASNAPCGEYAYDGYRTIIRSAPMDFKVAEGLLRHLLVDVMADDAVAPSTLELRIGASYQPADPNIDKCSLRWFQQAGRALMCHSPDGPSHVAARTRQATGIEWPVYIQDRYIVIEFAIDGVGGSSAFSKITFWVEKKR